MLACSRPLGAAISHFKGCGLRVREARLLERQAEERALVGSRPSVGPGEVLRRTMWRRTGRSHSLREAFGLTTAGWLSSLGATCLTSVSQIPEDVIRRGCPRQSPQNRGEARPATPRAQKPSCAESSLAPLDVELYVLCTSLKRTGGSASRWAGGPSNDRRMGMSMLALHSPMDVCAGVNRPVPGQPKCIGASSSESACGVPMLVHQQHRRWSPGSPDRAPAPSR